MKIFKIFKESINVVFNTKYYFKNYNTKKDIGESILKVIIYGIISSILFYLICRLNPYVNIFYKQLSGNLMSISFVVYSPVLSVILLSIIFVYNIFISAICKGSINIKDIIIASSSVMVVFPIISFFIIGYMINFYIGFFCSIIMLLYGIWLWYNSNIYFLKANKLLSIIAGIVFVILIMFIGYKVIVSYSFFTENIEKMLKKTNAQEGISEKSENNYKKSIKTMNKILEPYEK